MWPTTSWFINKRLQWHSIFSSAFLTFFLRLFFLSLETIEIFSSRKTLKTIPDLNKNFVVDDAHGKMKIWSNQLFPQHKKHSNHHRAMDGEKNETFLRPSFIKRKTRFMLPCFVPQWNQEKKGISWPSPPNTAVRHLSWPRNIFAFERLWKWKYWRSHTYLLFGFVSKLFLYCLATSGGEASRTTMNKKVTVNRWISNSKQIYFFMDFFDK